MDIRIGPKIKRILIYLNLYYARDITLKDMATLFNIHPAYLCRRFKKDLGIPFHEYLLRIRIQIAFFLLTHSEKSIKEISYDLGFSRPEIFSKAFKRLAGCSPKIYRAQALLNIEAPHDVIYFPDPTYPDPMFRNSDVTSIRPLQIDLDVKK
jgi:AraC-like DNA-binding protein